MSISSTAGIGGPEKVKTSDLPFEMVARSTKLTDKEKIGEAARQFESLLLRQMLSESTKNMGSVSGGEESDSTSSIYKDMINDQLADSISKSGAFGLAKSIQTQLATQSLPKQETLSTTAASTTKK